MAKITYEDKEFLNKNENIADKNKVNDTDLNEIKEVVNGNDDNIGNLSDLNTTDKSSVVNAINSANITFEKTTNGFNLKFANGFMIQKKKLTRVSVNCNTSAGNNTNLFYGTYDMGDWDVPFTELFDFTYTIGKVYGARQPWLSSNTWNGTDYVEDAPNNTWCGRLSMYLNWSAVVGCDLTCTGFGMWK